jgi:hypothetical protein
MVVPTTSVRRNSPYTSEITNKAFENGLLASHWFKIKLQQTVVSATYVYLGRRSTSEIYSDENFEDQHSSITSTQPKRRQTFQVYIQHHPTSLI